MPKALPHQFVPARKSGEYFREGAGTKPQPKYINFIQMSVQIGAKNLHFRSLGKVSTLSSRHYLLRQCTSQNMEWEAAVRLCNLNWTATCRKETDIFPKASKRKNSRRDGSANSCMERRSTYLKQALAFDSCN